MRAHALSQEGRGAMKRFPTFVKLCYKKLMMLMYYHTTRSLVGGSTYSKLVPGKLIFGHYIESVKILVILNPTGYMFTSSGFALFI